MKKILMTTVAATLMATAAVAGDFDNNEVTFELYRDNVAYTIGTVSGEATSIGVDVAVLPHDLFGATADLTLGAEYGIVSNDLTFSATYAASKNFNAVTAYGSVEAAYTVATGTTNGVWTATPLVGASYKFNERIDAFGELSYQWDVSNNWTAQGGLVEVGANYNVESGFYIRPSITRSFDTAADETNLAVKVGMSF